MASLKYLGAGQVASAGILGSEKEFAATKTPAAVN